MNNAVSIATTCPYCGVGCGVGLAVGCCVGCGVGCGYARSNRLVVVVDARISQKGVSVFIEPLKRGAGR